ncbi:MAG TPA: hypothetical protein VFJ01_06145 [Oleiagrimonas sp.]|nr:hypothetical protein [Oleiagrimonas sp.]
MWAWLWSKAGKWLSLAGGLVLMALGMCWYAFRCGERRQADRSAAARAKADEQVDMEARSTWSDAARAADQVRRDGKAKPAPDVQQRDDFDNHF